MAEKPVWTVEQIVAQLTNWGDAWSAGQPAAYSYFEQPPAYLGSPPGFSAFSSAQRLSVSRMLELVAGVANIGFTNVPDSGLEPDPIM